MSEGKKETSNLDIRNKVIVRWCNLQLEPRKLSLKSLSNADSVIVANLVEILSGKLLKGWTTHPKSKADHLKNYQIIFDSAQIKLEGFDLNDLVTNVKESHRILFCSLLFHYQLKLSRSWLTEEKALVKLRKDILSWLEKQKISISDICSSASNGNLLSKILANEGITVRKKTKPSSNVSYAIDIAHKKLQIPKIISSEEIISDVTDELSILLYLNYFKSVSQNSKKPSISSALTKKNSDPNLHQGETEGKNSKSVKKSDTKKGAERDNYQHRQARPASMTMTPVGFKDLEPSSKTKTGSEYKKLIKNDKGRNLELTMSEKKPKVEKESFEKEREPNNGDSKSPRGGRKFADQKSPRVGRIKKSHKSAKMIEEKDSNNISSKEENKIQQLENTGAKDLSNSEPKILAQETPPLTASSFSLETVDFIGVKNFSQTKVKINVSSSQKIDKLLSPKITDPFGTVVPCAIREGPNSVYYLVFSPQRIGEYSTEVTFNNEHINGSPLKFNVSPLERDDKEPQKLDLRPVRVLNTGEAFVGHATGFTTTRVTTNAGKTLRLDPALYRVEVTGSEVLLGEVINILQTGGLEVSFTPKAVGEHEVQVYVHNMPVLQRPYCLNVRIKPQDIDSRYLNEVKSINEIKTPNDFKIQIEPITPMETKSPRETTIEPKPSFETKTPRETKGSTETKIPTEVKTPREPKTPVEVKQEIKYQNQSTLPESPVFQSSQLEDLLNQLEASSPQDLNVNKSLIFQSPKASTSNKDLHSPTQELVRTKSQESINEVKITQRKPRRSAYTPKEVKSPNSQPGSPSFPVTQSNSKI